MSLYAIGDLHLSLGCDKPMDIFEGWHDYVQRLTRNWQRLVKASDTVVLLGDISWAMGFDTARADFAYIHSLPGKKIILKGNHDYWWSTMAKMQAFVQENGFDSISFLHNNSYTADGIAVCGTRGWLFETGEEQDAKVMNREIGRLRASLAAAEQGERVAFLHYPPLSHTASSSEVIAVLKEYGVSRCFYGHMHGPALRWAVQGEVDGIHYRLLSADNVGFCPVLVP